MQYIAPTNVKLSQGLLKLSKSAVNCTLSDIYRIEYPIDVSYGPAHSVKSVWKKDPFTEAEMVSVVHLDNCPGCAYSDEIKLIDETPIVDLPLLIGDIKHANDYFNSKIELL